MKISWGTGIVIAFVAFIGFILYFVVIASTDERANHDLVTDYYYERELGYQDEIDAERNASLLKDKVRVKPTEAGLSLEFPERWDLASLQGNVSLYRPSNKKLDFELPIALEGGEMRIPARRLPEGRWDITIRWVAGGKAYLQKERISFVH